MNCQYCGKPVGLLRRLKGHRYCSAEHQAADEVNPAAMVLKTILQTSPAENSATAAVSHTHSDAPAPEADAIAPPAAQAEDTDDAAFLSALLGNSEPATPPKAVEPPDPPAISFLMEPPAAQFQATGSSRRTTLTPKCLELEWVDCLGELAIGQACSTPLADPNLSFVAPVPVPDAAPTAEEMPWADFAWGLKALSGTIVPAVNLDYLRPRPGSRPSHAGLVLSAPLISGWESPSQPQPIENGNLASEPEPDTAEPDLQDSLMAMLMNLPG